jgi:hypothetical protein
MQSYLIVIPTTVFNRIAPTAVVDAIRADVKAALAKAFGGYTEVVGTGGYLADSGERIEERVYLIEACYETPDDELIERLAGRIKAELSQESVMIKKDGAARFF